MREQRIRGIKSVGERYAALELRTTHTQSQRYRVVEHIWDKEDVKRAEQGLPPLFDKYRDKQTKNYVRAQYKVDPVTK